VPSIQYTYWTQQPGYTVSLIGDVQSVDEYTTGKLLSQVGLVKTQMLQNIPAQQLISTPHGNGIFQGFRKLEWRGML